MSTPERVKVEEVLVLHVPDDHLGYDGVDIGDEDIAKATGATVIVLRGSATLESLDEDEMRAAGWVRAPRREAILGARGLRRDARAADSSARERSVWRVYRGALADAWGVSQGTVDKWVDEQERESP